MTGPTISTCLWFDFKAEEAVDHYLSVFPDGKRLSTSYYKGDGPGPKGAAMTIAFELQSRPFLALNGGPMFKFSPAFSLIVNCETQDEIDHYWERLSEGGAKSRCGWLSDKFGLSWQIIPRAVERFMTGDAEAAGRVMKAVLQMDKLDIAELERAYAG